MRFKSYWFGVLFMLFPFAAASPASANAVWIDGKPVFLSDIQRRQPRIERRRPRPPASLHPVYPKHASGGPQPAITAEAPEIVSLPQPEKPGTVIIDQQDRKLFYVLTDELAYLYPISVGRDGFRWTGEKKISAIRDWPKWIPPSEMRERQPWLPVTMSGGINNPLGAKALYLGSSLYRIHGTNDPNSIGRASSSGCFRMMNKHVLHLATMVDVGTTVRVLRTYPG
jgi:lipoprotein-anchoring transpeptidase ErfK/SrfK